MLMSYSKVKGGDIDLAPAEICCSLLHSLWSLRTQSKIKLLFFTRTLRCGARAWLRQEEPEQHHHWLFCLKVRHSSDTLVRSSNSAEASPQRFLSNISLISVLLLPIITTCSPIITLLLLILDFLLLLIHTFVIPIIIPGKKKVKWDSDS